MRGRRGITDAADNWAETKSEYNYERLVVIPYVSSQKDIIFALLCFEIYDLDDPNYDPGYGTFFNEPLLTFQ